MNEQSPLLPYKFGGTPPPTLPPPRPWTVPYPPGEDAAMGAPLGPRLPLKPMSDAPPDLSYRGVTSALLGKGQRRKPTKDFWEVWENWHETLQMAGLRLLKDARGWKVDISILSEETIDWAHFQIQSRG